MLTRAFRVTDKFSNAFLKLTVWFTQWLLIQISGFRDSFEASIVGIYRGTTRTIDTVSKAYEATDEKRRAIMAQRAIVSSDSKSLQPAIIEDPLVKQNRTLSVFVVVLMIALIGVVFWATNQSGTGGGGTGQFSLGFGGQNTSIPTAPNFPTAEPTATPVPQPLNWRGTLIYTARIDGQDDLFAIQRGDNEPRRLTNSAADDRDAAWSPDGRSIAYVSNEEGAWELYVMDVISKQKRRLTFSTDYVGAPSWSPDGTFIVFESYINNNLDLFIQSSDLSGTCGQAPCQLTSQPGPDFEPNWMPAQLDGSGGRLIAYTSIRGATQDIYVLDLDNPNDDSAINITNSPNIDENYADWNPQGDRLAYSMTVDGITGVYYRDLEIIENDDGSSQITVGGEVAVGRGRMPVWNPIDGSGLFYSAIRNNTQSQIIGSDPSALGGGGDVQIVQGLVEDLDWVGVEPVFEGVVASYAPLYNELSSADADGRYGLAQISNIDAPDPLLNARVDDSFNALRARTFELTGIDCLGELEEMFWRLDRQPEQGQPRENWHYAGRAIAFDRGLALQGFPTQMVVARDQRELGVYWTIYLRVSEDAQNGRLGEPIKEVTWDFAARTDPNNLDAYQAGGERMSNIPTGYYINFTELAADYGWYPLPSDRTWRQNYAGILYWEFVNTDGMDWRTAMGELYPASELDALGRAPIDATATLPEFQEPTPTEAPERTATPIPPDQQ